MKEFVVKVQQTAEGRFYASTEVNSGKFIITWGYTRMEVKMCIRHAIMFSTGLTHNNIQLVDKQEQLLYYR